MSLYLSDVGRSMLCMPQVLSKSFILPSGAICWGLILEGMPGERHRLDAPSDFLVADAASEASPMASCQDLTGS